MYGIIIVPAQADFRMYSVITWLDKQDKTGLT